MIVEVWLLWSLLAGKPVDVDSFLDKEQCEATLMQGVANLEHNREAAKAGGAPKEVLDRLAQMGYLGCTPARGELKLPNA